MNIGLPNISPEVMKKYPLYVLIAFLSAFVGYYINNSSSSSLKLEEVYRTRTITAERRGDSLERENSKFKDALLIQHGIIQDYQTVTIKTDSLTNKKLSRPIKELINSKR